MDRSRRNLSPAHRRREPRGDRLIIGLRGVKAEPLGSATGQTETCPGCGGRVDPMNLGQVLQHIEPGHPRGRATEKQKPPGD